MMNYIWAGMLLLSLFCAIINGNLPALSEAVITGGSSAVTLCIRLLGMLCLWGGLMKIAEESGLAKVVGRLLSPLMRLIFPRMRQDSPAAQAITMNVTANLLGLGNAATPLGLEAMRRLQEENSNPLLASDDMVSFVVLNTAALHLVPTTVAMLRQQFGAESPMDIMPAAWLTSLAALTVGIVMTRLLRRVGGTTCSKP